jgi:hypothetical protein
MIKINETHPDVVAYRASLKDLANARAILAKKKEALNDATQKYMAQKAAPRSRLDFEADQVLSGMGHSVDWISPEKLESISREVEVMERVVQRQQDTAHNLRSRYSAAVCQQKDQQDRYIAIERRIASACAELAAANEAEVRFFDELHAIGVSPHFRPMRVGVIGLPSDPNSVATFHRKEVKQYCPEALA